MIIAGALLAVVIYATGLIWYWSANRLWAARVLGYDPGSPPDEVRFVQNAPSTGVRLVRMMGTPSPDPETEQLRVRSNRRLAIVLWLMPSIVVLPALAALLETAAARFGASGLLGLPILAFESALWVVWVFRLGRTVVAYGNGAPLVPRVLLTGLGGAIAVVALVVFQVMLMGGW